MLGYADALSGASGAHGLKVATITKVFRWPPNLFSKKETQVGVCMEQGRRSTP